MKLVVLNDWTEFENRLRSDLKAIGHHWQVTVRNFLRISHRKKKEVDSLILAQRTGTDRDANSPFWNAEGHDHNHDRQPMNKQPDEIIYAYTLNLDKMPYEVLHRAPIGDVTYALSEADSIVVYDTSKLERVSPNEYWFKTPPMEAALLIFSVVE